MLLLEHGTIIDPLSKKEWVADILVDGKKIKKIGQNLAAELSAEGCPAEKKSGEVSENVTRIDVSGKYVLPGLVDVHVHFRDPGFTYKEDIESGAKAAAKGGVTTVVLMANTKPAVDNEETLKYVLEKGGTTGIHVETCTTITKGMQGQELVDMETLKAAGAKGFTDDGVPILEENLVRRAMEQAKALSMPLSFHEEDPAFIQNNGINAGKAAAHFGIGGSNREAEISLVARDLEIALETGACVNVQHISTREAVELVRQAKEKGGDVHAEATPHHIVLTEDAAIQYGTMAKMNPPLREEEDRQAIIDALLDGTIDLIATDHAPHSAEEKAKAITEAPSGIIGLETALSLCFEELVQKAGMPMTVLMEKMALNPAQMYHLDAGYIGEGGPADLCVFDANAVWTPKSFLSKSQNSPFVDRTLKGVVDYTIVEGEIVYKNR